MVGPYRLYARTSQSPLSPFLSAPFSVENLPAHTPVIAALCALMGRRDTASLARVVNATTSRLAAALTHDTNGGLSARMLLRFLACLGAMGGVTSSSLEVLAALVLTDAEFSQHMCVPVGGPTPAFYARYVQEVQAIITENAKLEFECLWKAHAAPGAPAISVLSDSLSLKITELSDRIETSDSLWANELLRARVLEGAIPATLAALVGGVSVVRARLPENYQRADRKSVV